MDQLFIGRQAIYDRANHLFGYELLYRADELNHASFNEGRIASSHVILTAFLDMGLERLVGSNRAFINLTSEFLEGTIPLPVAPEQVVVEINDEIKPSDTVIGGLRHLVERGFTIALDDTLVNEANEPLLALAHIIKVDTLSHDYDGIRALYEKLRAYPVKLLAEKIESEEMLLFCQSLGFDYFQGFHLHRPQVIAGKQLPNNAMVIQLLLAKLQEPQVDLCELAQLIALDAALSYQLLRYLNCASYGNRQEIDSVAQAIRLLGITALHQWARLIELKQYSRAQPRELLLLGLVRARMCERLAQLSSDISSEQAFTVGQLSILEKLLQTPLDELLDDVPLSMPVKMAVLEWHGTLGELLALSTSVEKETGEHAGHRRLPETVVRQCYGDALQWATTQMKAIHI